METKNNKLGELLYRSFDTELNEQQQQILDDGVQKDVQLAGEKEFIADLRNKLASLPADFSDQFETNLMHQLEQELHLQKVLTIKPSTFRAIALSGVAAIIAVLISVYFIDGSLSLDSLMGINGYNPDMGMLTFF